MKKRILLSIILLLMLTGCTVVNLSGKNYEQLVNTVISQDMTLVNSSSKGYTYYIPRTFHLLDKNENNLELRDEHNVYYLYIDAIRYYHKDKINFTPLSGAIYSNKITYEDKEGYLDISKVNGFYFIEAMYHYAKIEAYVLEDDLNDSLVNIFTILNSVQFKDDILNTLIGENILNYQAEKFNIMKPNRVTKDFLDYVQEYDKYDDGTASDEDEIDDELIKDEDTIDLEIRE